MENDTPRQAPRISEVLERFGEVGHAEWDPQLSAVIRWDGHGSFSRLDAPFKIALASGISQHFNRWGLVAYLKGRGYKRVAKEDVYEIWEVPNQAGGYELVTLPTDRDAVGYDQFWGEAVGQIAECEGWQVAMTATVMIPEALREACESKEVRDAADE
jgi:hypothetical protein